MGDRVLLEFPNVAAAVECAIAIQKLMTEARRIVYRIGVSAARRASAETSRRPRTQGNRLKPRGGKSVFNSLVFMVLGAKT